MKRTVSLILALVMLFALASCGQGGSSSAGTTSSNQTSGTTAPSRDSVNIAIGGALDVVDPHASAKAIHRMVFWQMYNGLMHYNELTGETEYDLAVSHEVSADGKTYTFKLRDDAYFHNGDKVTAKDVVFSYKRAADPAMSIAQYTSNFVDAVAVDETTVQIILSAPFAPFLVNCCQIFILSEREVTAQGDKFGTQLTTAGAGPYKMTYHDADTKITLEAFDKYFKGEATIKTINFYPISDTSAGLISFESGDLDWYSCGVMDAQRIQMEGKYNVEFMAANHITFLMMNPVDHNEAIKDERVRKAIAYAINKEELNAAAFEGLGMVADYMENPNWNVGAPVGDVVYTYNPEKAKELLKEAGYPNGVDVGTLLCFKGSHFETCANVVQQQLAAVGITVTLEWNEQSAALSRFNKEDYNIGLTGGANSGDYDSLRKRFYSTLTVPYVDFSKTEYGNEFLDTKMDEAAACTDPVKRLEITKEINDYFMNTATYIPLLHKVVPAVWNKDLNVVNRPQYPLIYEWSWN